VRYEVFDYTKKKNLNYLYKYLLYSILGWKNPQQTGYVPEDWLHYTEGNKFEDWHTADLKKLWDSHNVTHYVNTKTNAQFNLFTRKGSEEAIVCYRGTVELNEWIADFVFKLKKFDLVKGKENLYSTEDLAEIVSRSTEGLLSSIQTAIFENNKLIKPFTNFFKEKKEDIEDNIDNLVKSSGDVGKNIKNIYENIADKINFHSGFATHFNSIVDETDKVMEKLVRGSKYSTIMFTGDSLGSAMSKLAFLRYTAMYPKKFGKFKNVSFGSPHIGSPIIQKIFTNFNNLEPNKIIICNCEGDLISKCPPASLGFEKYEKDFTVEIPAVPVSYVTGFNHAPFYLMQIMKRNLGAKLVL
jgi:hypothetical protein